MSGEFWDQLDVWLRKAEASRRAEHEDLAVVHRTHRGGKGQRVTGRDEQTKAARGGVYQSERTD